MSSSAPSSLFRRTAFAALWTCASTAPIVAQPGQWDSGPPLHTPRRLLAAAEHAGEIYTFGGCGSPCFAPPLHTSTLEERTVEVFTPRDPNNPQSRDRWSSRRAMPSIVFGAAAAALPAGDRIILFGGFVTPTLTQAYDPVHDTWQPRAALPTPRYGLAAVAVEDKIYVIGGSNGATAVAAIEAYDPARDTWERDLPAMPTARVFLAAAAVGTKIFAIGGSPDCCGNATTNVVEIYDTVEKTWTHGPVLPLAMQTSAAAVSRGKVYVLGGFVPGQGAKGATFALDPTNLDAGWVLQTSMPVARDQAPAVALGDRIHVIGGATACHCRPRGDHPIFIPSRTDLAITKIATPADVCPGETVTYRIEVTNEGTSPVHGARVDDPADGSNRVFQNVLPGATWTCAASGPDGTACGDAGPQPAPIHDRSVELPAGGTVTYEVTGIVAVGASGTFSNRARVSLPEGITDEDPSDNLSAEVESEIHRDRLELRKIRVPAGAPPASVLDVLSYEITVTNHCAIPLTVTVDDSVIGLVARAWCRRTHAGCSPLMPSNLHDVVVVPAKGSITYMDSGTVPCDCATPNDTIVNVATASAPGQEQQIALVSTPILPTDHRLAVAITGPDTLPLGSCSSDYTFTVTNPGPCPALGAVLEVTVPPELRLSSLSAPCSGIGPCVLDNVPAMRSVAVTGRIEPTAGARCDSLPPPEIHASAGNTCLPPPASPATASTAAAIPCDVAITKSDGLTEAAPGDCIAYTIGVANHGCGDVFDVTVTDTFPPKLTSAGWCPGEACDPTQPGPLVDKLDLPRLSSQTYRVAGTISPDFVGTLANTASVSFGAVDQTPADNTAMDLTDVVPRPGVDAQCTGTPDLVPEGGSVTFTFVLWNGGPAAQGDNPGDELLDVLPAGLTLVSAVASSGTITVVPANTVHWNGAIPVNVMVTIDVTATPDAGTMGMSFCNPATVFFDLDGDGINESSAASDDRCHPCCFTVTGPQPIPTLSPLALALLVLLTAGIAVGHLRRRRPSPPGAS